MSVELRSQYDALLLDLDGTVWSGGEAIEDAPESIEVSGLPAAYITNNASRSSAEVARKLGAIGLEVQSGDVFTSAQAAVALAAQYASLGDPVLVVGADFFKVLVIDAGFRVVESADDNPVVVLHGHNPDTGWRQLSEAALAIRAGARYVATNVDTTLPSQRGLMVGNGSMAAAITSATGVTPIAAGKPSPFLFRQATEALHAAHPLAVGDRLDTDIAGAVAAGIDSLHVLTGVSGPWDLFQAPPEQRPTYVGESMKALRRPVDDVTPGPHGGFLARCEGDEVVLHAGNDGASYLDALLTVVDVAWKHEGVIGNLRPESSFARDAVAKWW